MFPPPIVCRRTHRWNAMCCPFPLMHAEARSGRRDFPDLPSPNLVLALGREKSPSRRLHLFLQQLPSLFTSHRSLVNPQQPPLSPVPAVWSLTRGWVTSFCALGAAFPPRPLRARPTPPARLTRGAEWTLHRFHRSLAGRQLLYWPLNRSGSLLMLPKEHPVSERKAAWLRLIGSWKCAQVLCLPQICVRNNIIPSELSWEALLSAVCNHNFLYVPLRPPQLFLSNSRPHLLFYGFGFFLPYFFKGSCTR